MTRREEAIAEAPTPAPLNCTATLACTAHNNGRYRKRPVEPMTMPPAPQLVTPERSVDAIAADAALLNEVPSSWTPRTIDTSSFSCFRGSRSPRFVTESEYDCARVLDFYGVAWEYEPVTFVLETGADGRVLEAFSPDFYLPEQNLFLEVTSMRQDLVTRKNRKVRKLRQRYPDVQVKLFYRRDIEALGQQLRSRSPMPLHQSEPWLAPDAIVQ